MTIRKYRKKPIVIEAGRWIATGDHPKVAVYRCAGDAGGLNLCSKCNLPLGDHGWIDTLEGGHIVCPGDWIIKGVQGEFYPCKPDIFEATYDLTA